VLVLFNKPYAVLSQFSGDGGVPTLADYIDIREVYAAGRLDADSEGLLALTNNGALQAAIAGVQSRVVKTYCAQVEGIATDVHAERLATGVDLNDGRTKPATCRVLDEMVEPWPRTPPIRYRKNVQDSWIELTISEGRNRQVRRMTANVGLPTLRLIRVAIGPWRVDSLLPGEYRVIDDDKAFALLRGSAQNRV
jgi:23S rRNA pseudouridine2457 synthase